MHHSRDAESACFNTLLTLQIKNHSWMRHPQRTASIVAIRKEATMQFVRGSHHPAFRLRSFVCNVCSCNTEEEAQSDEVPGVDGSIVKTEKDAAMQIVRDLRPLGDAAGRPRR